jgi:hypothetical protein
MAERLDADVICFGPPKEAALYFDRVFPFDSANAVFHKISGEPLDPNCVPITGNTIDTNVLYSLFGQNSEGLEAYIKQVVTFAVVRTLRHAESDHEIAEIILADKRVLNDNKRLASIVNVDIETNLRSILNGDFDYQDVSRKLTEDVARAIEVAGFSDAPGWDAEPSNQVLTEGTKNDFFAALTGLKLVDINKMSWEQVVEFRKDKDSRAALRRLRLFFSENYAGKDRAFIVDDLLSRIDRQEQVAKTWGLQTTLRSLAVAFTDRSILMTTVGGLAVAATGAPLPIAATAGAIITAGSCGLEFGKAVVERRIEEIDRSTQYLTILKQRFK